MKNMTKILLIIFFFIFSYINGFDTSAIRSQDAFAVSVKNNHTSIEKAGIESYIVLPVNNSDNNTSSDLDEVANFNYTQNDFFNDNYNKKFSLNNITYLFKTEVKPNAP